MVHADRNEPGRNVKAAIVKRASSRSGVESSEPARRALQLVKVTAALQGMVQERRDYLTLRSFTALVLLFDGPMTIAELGKRLGLQRPSVHRMIESFELLGFAHRQPAQDPADGRRRSVVALLPLGRERIDRFVSCLM